MNLAGKIVVVTGGASGIGAALARRFAQASARRVVVVDRDLGAAQAVADEVDGVAEPVDVTDPVAVNGLVERTWRARRRSTCSARTPASPPASVSMTRTTPGTGRSR